MKVKRIHSIILKNVKINPKDSECFLDDLELLGITVDDVRDELEGQKMLVYTGDFTMPVRFKKCPWCGSDVLGDFHGYEHIAGHGKTKLSLQVLRFQQEMYREKLRLLRAGKIDHTYFTFTNWQCQCCDDMRKRGRGLCSIAESARNKVRSIIVLGLESDGLNKDLTKQPNIGYIIGKA